jgi:hypothetical protein
MLEQKKEMLYVGEFGGNFGPFHVPRYFLGCFFVPWRVHMYLKSDLVECERGKLGRGGCAQAVALVSFGTNGPGRKKYTQG